MTSNEETESNVERRDSNRVYVKNPQEEEDITKVDITKVTSKDQESEST